MKAHIREEKKTTPLKLGEGTLLQEEDGKIYKVCDTVEYIPTMKLSRLLYQKKI